MKRLSTAMTRLSVIQRRMHFNVQRRGLSAEMIMTKEMLIQIINEAQRRADSKSLPLDARVRSRVTVNDCICRADKEGWSLIYSGKGRWMMEES